MPEQFFTTEDVARTLQITRDTVTNLIKRNELSAIKIGREYRISSEFLSQFIARKGAR